VCVCVCVCVCEVTFSSHGKKSIEYFSELRAEENILTIETVKWSMKKVRIKRQFPNIYYSVCATIRVILIKKFHMGGLYSESRRDEKQNSGRKTCR